MKINHKVNQFRKRVENYPSLPDQIDAIYKGFVALEKSGFELPQETKNWIAQITEIKQKYNKR